MNTGAGAAGLSGLRYIIIDQDGRSMREIQQRTVEDFPSTMYDEIAILQNYHFCFYMKC